MCFGLFCFVFVWERGVGDTYRSCVRCVCVIGNVQEVRKYEYASVGVPCHALHGLPLREWLYHCGPNFYVENGDVHRYTHTCKLEKLGKNIREVL